MPLTLVLWMTARAASAAPEPAPAPEPASAPAPDTEPDGPGRTAPPRVPLPPEKPAPIVPLDPIAANRTWDRLPAPGDDLRAALRVAGDKLGTWSFQLAGVDIDGARLARIADTAPDEPLNRAAREDLRLPVDLEDLLYFVDDMLVAGDKGRRGQPFTLPPGRARSAGILLHPNDVFETNKPQLYPDKPKLAVDQPPPQESFPEAKDGEILGPNWTMRYRSPGSVVGGPGGREEMYRTLAEKRPDATFSSRIAALVSQLEQQGTEVYLTSFLRYRERGYLMWGSYLLRKCTTASCVTASVKKLDAANRSWAHVKIKWTSPGGWRSTIEAARKMADAFDVVFATEHGARNSNHYDGTAADFTAMSLPRSLELYAPNGAHKVFDLSGGDEPRDLSLTPAVIDWIEENFALHKLESDHPHWDDAEAM